MGRIKGGALMLLAGIIGAGASAYDYVTPATGIDHTGGVQLVLVSSLLMAAAALGLLALRAGKVAGILLFLIVLDILGTASAAWFLESVFLMGAMIIAAIGVLSWISSCKAAATPAANKVTS